MMTHDDSTDDARPDDSAERSAGPGHDPFHLDQIGQIPIAAAGSARFDLWGIVVPTARPLGISSGLACAARLATEWDANLLILRSGAASLEPFPRALLPRTSRPVAVVDLPADADRFLPAWRSSASPVATLGRDSDLALKRNFGLLTGRMSGPGQAMMFLDDDVAPIPSPASARSEEWTATLRVADALAAFAQSPELRVAGWVERNYPDNSVVCHARRLVGMDQGVFVSGGAMMVRIDAPLPRFSRAYNEDWFFFFESMRHESRAGGPSVRVRRVADVHQDRYQPFLVGRAISEELGDIVGEGLFAVVGRSREEILLAATSAIFWEGIIRARQAMIHEILDRLQAMRASIPLEQFVRVSAALWAALDVHASDPAYWARRLAEFIHWHLADAAEWADLLAAVTPTAGVALSLEEALSSLGLAQFTTWLGGNGRRVGPADGLYAS